MSDPQLYSNEKFIVPDGAEVSWLTTNHGKLRCACWHISDAQNPRGTIILTHGLSEHIDKYYATISKLIERGFAVAMMDLRGHGLSTRLDEKQDYLQQFDADFTQFMNDKVLGIMPEPYIGMGHSTGGCLTCCAAHDHPEWFKAAVLSAPMLGILNEKRIPLFAFIVYGMKLIPLALRRFIGSNQPVCFTNDQKRFYAYRKLREAHPDLAPSRDLISFAASSLDRFATMRAAGWYQKIDTPMLIFTAAQESLVDNQAIQTAVKQLPHAQLHTVTSAQHEILMELDMVQETLWAQFDNFMYEHAPQKSSPSQSPQQLTPPAPRDNITLKMPPS